MSRALTLFNIPLGRPFFPTFVESLLAGEIVPALHRLSDPLAFADTTIFVPTRRAGQALGEALRAAFGVRPILLPRIVPLGDPADLDDRSILAGDDIVAVADIPPPVAPLHRRLVLMRLIEAWRQAIRHSLMQHDEWGRPLLRSEEFFEVAASPADAFGLAGDLAALMDEIIIEDADWAKLGSPAPEHDRYWDITAAFLGIAAEAWPGEMAAAGTIDEAERRKRLLRHEAERLRRERPAAPMIVAGSTGSQPATADLMQAIAALPNGAVVLPGLDQHLDEVGWAAITLLGGDLAPALGSPQAILKRLVELRFGLGRKDVREIAPSDLQGSTHAEARGRLVSEMLRPAATTDHWANARATNAALLDTALTGIAIVEAADEREEALAIAIRMREVLRDETSTAMLVTPDRGLGLRVSAELKRFGVRIDDSAGCRLAQTPCGQLAALVVEAAETGCDPMSLMALLRHGKVRLKRSRAEIDAMADALDIAVLRTIGISPSLPGLRLTLQGLIAEPAPAHRLPRAARRLQAKAAALAIDLLDPIEAAIAPLIEAMTQADLSIGRLGALHRAALIALCEDETGDSAFFADEDGEALDALFEALIATPDAGFDASGGAGATYRALFEALLTGETVHPRSLGHPRLKLYGPLEARLLDADLVIIGGVNEGSWPPVAQTDAFLTRGMRAAIGLGPPERRIGQNAHDFAMLMGARSVMVTRPLRSDGTPMIASRYLRRLKAYAGEQRFEQAVARGAFYVDAARRLDDLPAGTAARYALRPKPTPALSLRPQSLSLTEIETLYRDPYAIFARHVLQLDPLGERLPQPDQRDYGNAVHAAVAAFILTYDSIPEAERLGRLLALGRDEFGKLGEHRHIDTFWWPRFRAEAAWFVAAEQQRRPSILKSVIERSGRLQLVLPDGSPFVLRGRADRIDLTAAGGFAVIDYKTGVPPGAKEVLKGISPQLTLTAMMVREGGFKDIPSARRLTEALYIRLSGSGEGGKIVAITPKPETLDDIVARHRSRLLRTLGAFRNKDHGYLSRKMPKTLTYAGDYDHLARVLEWNEPGEDAEEIAA